MGKSPSSSRRSVRAWSLEFGPSWILASLAVATGLTAVAAILVSEPPVVPSGILILCCLALSLHHLYRALRPPVQALAHIPGRGWRCRCRGEGWADCRPGPGSRLLGPVIGLDLETARGRQRVCVAQDQVPRRAWRRLRAGLLAAGRSRTRW